MLKVIAEPFRIALCSTLNCKATLRFTDVGLLKNLQSYPVALGRGFIWKHRNQDTAPIGEFNSHMSILRVNDLLWFSQFRFSGYFRSL